MQHSCELSYQNIKKKKIRTTFSCSLPKQDQVWVFVGKQICFFWFIYLFFFFPVGFADIFFQGKRSSKDSVPGQVLTLNGSQASVTALCNQE